MWYEISEKLKVHFYGIEYLFNRLGSVHHIFKKERPFFEGEMIRLSNMPYAD
jgi:hypothetical protein